MSVSFMSNVLLTGLIFLPLLGNVASTLLWSYTRNQLFSWVPRGLSAGLVLAVAWVLRGQSFEQIIGGWQPVSLTGSPLILADNLSGHALLIAWVSVHFYEAYVRRNDSRDWRLTDGVIAGAIHLAIVVTAFAQNFVTLLIGLGLIDLLTELRALQSRQHEGRRNTNLLFMASSLAMLTAGMVLHVAQYNSLYFPLARLGPQTANLLFIGLALRLWLLPIHTPQVSYLSVSSTASAALPGWIAHGLGTLLLIDQLSRVGLGAPPTWLVLLLLLSALLMLAQGVITQVPERARHALLVGTFQLACLCMLQRYIKLIAAAGIAWLLSNLLINHRPTANVPIAVRFGQLTRLFGVACLAGIPFTVGFVGRAGLAEEFIRSGGLGLLLVILMTLAQAASITVALRIALNIPIEVSASESVVTNVSLIPGLLAFLVVCAPSILFGLAPTLLGLSNGPLGRAGVWSWFTSAIALALGVGLWWLESRWFDRIEARVNTLESVLSLHWLRSIFAGALERLAKPLRTVFPFLESDGAMLWAVMVVLLLVAISRGNP